MASDDSSMVNELVTEPWIGQKDKFLKSGGWENMKIRRVVTDNDNGSKSYVKWDSKVEAVPQISLYKTAPKPSLLNHTQ